jgi:hypothetical protein
MAGDAALEEKNYEGPTDDHDRREFASVIAELRDILSMVPHIETARALSQLKQIEEGFW